MGRRTGISWVFDLVENSAAALAWLCGGVMKGLNGLFMPASRGLSFGRNSLIPFWFILLWMGANVLIFLALFAGCFDRGFALGFDWSLASGSVQLEKLCLWLAVFMTLLHVVLLVGRILVVLEDNSVMNGLLREKYRVFPGHIIHNSAVCLLVSVVFYVLFGILVLWQAERLFPGVLAQSLEPGYRAQFADWVVLFLQKGVPLADRLLEFAGVVPVVEFADGFGKLVAVGIYVLNGVLLYYAVVLWARQWYQLWALFAALSNDCTGEACKADIHLL